MTTTELLEARGPDGSTLAKPDLRTFTLGCEGKHIRPECWKSTKIEDDGRVAKACPDCGRFMGYLVPTEKSRGARGGGRGK